MSSGVRKDVEVMLKDHKIDDLPAWEQSHGIEIA